MKGKGIISHGLYRNLGLQKQHKAAVCKLKTRFVIVILASLNSRDVMMTLIHAM